jgi:hypothetical protein
MRRKCNEQRRSSLNTCITIISWPGTKPFGSWAVGEIYCISASDHPILSLPPEVFAHDNWLTDPRRSEHDGGRLPLSPSSQLRGGGESRLGTRKVSRVTTIFRPFASSASTPSFSGPSPLAIRTFHCPQLLTTVNVSFSALGF